MGHTCHQRSECFQFLRLQQPGFESLPCADVLNDPLNDPLGWIEEARADFHIDDGFVNMDQFRLKLSTPCLQTGLKRLPCTGQFAIGLQILNF